MQSCNHPIIHMQGQAVAASQVNFYWRKEEGRDHKRRDLGEGQCAGEGIRVRKAKNRVGWHTVLKQDGCGPAFSFFPSTA